MIASCTTIRPVARAGTQAGTKRDCSQSPIRFHHRDLEGAGASDSALGSASYISIRALTL